MPNKRKVCMFHRTHPDNQSGHYGDFGGLAPQTKLQAPKLKYETLQVSGNFVKFECQAPCTNIKPPAQT